MFINKTYETKKIKGTSTLFFKFIGYPKIENEITPQEKLEELLDNCFDNNNNNSNIVRDVESIRTIISDYQEKYLEIKITNTFGELEHLRYMNGVLTLYEVQKNLGNESYNIKYDMYKKLNIDLPSKYVDKSELVDHKQTIIDLINKFLENVNNLKNIKTITLDEEGKILYHIYNLFYNEVPDFSDKDINTKFQSMMAILTEFGLCINDKLSFSMNYKHIPISIYLQQKLEKYRALGKIENLELPFTLSVYADSIIKEVSNIIRSSIPEEYDETEVLQKISSIIYTKAHKVSSRAKVEEIAELTHSAPLEVKDTLKLVKRINDRIYR